jgi:gliding motility-associated-like protein
MNKIVWSVLILSAFFFSTSSYANHIFGADFYYEYLSGNTYRISLAIYGDCNSQGTGGAFDNLPFATPEVEVLNGNIPISSLILSLEGPGVDVTPVCPRDQLNTKCNGGTIDGVKRFIYSTTVNINVVSSALKFRFEGALGNSSAGRSNQITNIANPGSSIMVLEAELNNLQGPNSSPRFTTIPTPFYCVNVPQQYNQGAVDANNDSLGYQLGTPLQATGFVSYVGVFSPTNPLSYVASTFTFSPITGQLNFTPDITQKALIINKVNEYRNGVKVGSASRELTFVVLANCSANTPPSGDADTTSSTSVGGILVGNSTFNVCEGTSLVKFDIKPRDADGDSIEVSINGLPTGANALIANNNSPNPLINFSWPTSGVAPGNYNFFVTYRDQGCPISAGQTQAYTVSIIRPNQVSRTILYPTECAHKAQVQYNFSNGLVPRNVVLRKGSAVVRTFIDNTGQFIDSLEAGTYTFTITSPNLTCPTVQNITITDSGVYPYPPVTEDTFYCLNDVAVRLNATPDSLGTIFWYDSLGIRLPAAPLPVTTTAGIFRYGASQKVKVCESRVDTALVYVTKRPIADFSIDPSPICARDTANITFTGAIGVGPILDYKWAWGTNLNPVSGSGGGPYRFSWFNPGTYTIGLQVFENRCPSDPVTKQVRVKLKPVASFSLLGRLCQYDSVAVVYNSPDSLAGQQYAWDFDNATQPNTTDKGPFRLYWQSSGIKRISLQVALEGCVDTISRTTTVNEVPDATILNASGTVCLGDKILLQHTPGSSSNTYTWLPKEEVRFELDGSPYTRVLAPTTYKLIVTNEYNCVDSDAITYNKIEPCCQFSYPNAFTPNNDGVNDKYKVMLYGNEQYYDLSIYNRWGQRIYHTANPRDAWDGTFNNKECEAGAYFYMVRAKCLTGYEERKQGELTLIR